ncbi:MAG TPA: hypothetical protein VFG42_17565 [Baekduia sp.]|nr:hypothetical protein [Baekduia sp.]
MRLRSRPAGPASSRPRADEDGFALIEVMVSAVLLITIALATMKLIDSSQQGSARLRSKGVATALAAADLNRLRQTKFSTSTTFPTQTRTTLVDGVQYTIVSKGTWTSSAGILNTCTTSSGTPGQYLRFDSTVTWPNMGNVRPVTAETLMVPRPGEVAITTGGFTMQVVNMAGNPVSGVAVTIAGQTLVTSAAGCVNFTTISPGTYTATYSKGSYVDATGAATGTYANAVITKGNTASKTVLYDVPATITPVKYYLQNTSGSDSTTSTTWSGSYGLSPAQASAIMGATSTTKLFPWSGGYQVFAGGCVGNNPVTYTAEFANAFPASAVAPGPGGQLGASAYLRTATLKVTSVPAKQAVNVRMLPNVAFSAGMATGCDASTRTSQTAPSTPTTSDLTYTWNLPYGVYSYCVDNGTNRYVGRTDTHFNNTPPLGVPTPTATLSVPWSTVKGFSEAGKCDATGITG